MMEKHMHETADQVSAMEAFQPLTSADSYETTVKKTAFVKEQNFNLHKQSVQYLLRILSTGRVSLSSRNSFLRKKKRCLRVVLSVVCCHYDEV